MDKIDWQDPLLSMRYGRIILAFIFRPFYSKPLLGLSILLMLSPCVFAQSPKSLNIAYANVESFPYFLTRSNSVPKNPGISVEIIQMVCKELNIQGDFSRLPGKRVLVNLKRNLVDGAFLFSYKPERAVFSAYPLQDGQVNAALKMDTISYFFYTLKDSPITWKNGQLGGTNKVGVNLGYSVIGQIKKMGLGVNEVQSTVESLKILLKKRVLVVAAQEYPFERHWAAHTGKINKLYPPIRTKDYFFIFSQDFYLKNTEFCNDFWEKIAQVSKREYPRLIKKYLAKIES